MSAARRSVVLVLLLSLGGARSMAQPAETTGTPAAQEPVTAEVPVQTLDELLERVRAGRVRNAAADAERAARFAQQKEQQQEALETARKELAAAHKRAVELERQWEANQLQLAEQQTALRARLGSLAEVFSELGRAGEDLRARLRESATAPQLGAERLAELDRLLETAASGTRLPAIAQFDMLWFELQRELAESGRVRRFPAEISAADGTRERVDVVRAGGFALFDADGAYLLHDGGGALRRMARQPASDVIAEAAVLAGASSGRHPLTLDPTTATGASALRAAVAVPTLAERVGAGGTLGWLAMLLGLAAGAFALYRLAVLERLRSRIGAEHAAAPNHPLGSLRALALQQVQLDAGALEHALHEAVLHELPRLESGLAPLRTLGSVLPLLGVLGTVLALAAADPGNQLESGVRLFTADLGQALVNTVQGLLAGIAVLLLQASLAARVRDFVLLLEEEAAALVTERAMATI